MSLVANGTCTLQSQQAGDPIYLPANPVAQSFTVSAQAGGESGDVPLPGWALVLLGAGLASRLRKAHGARTAG